MIRITLTILAALLLGAASCSKNGENLSAPETPAPGSGIEIADRPESIGIWTSRSELATIPMSGNDWDLVKKAADNKNIGSPDIGNQDDNADMYVLAAGIAAERYYAAGNNATGDAYRAKVVKAIETIIAAGCPPDSRSLAWGRNVAGYAMAADLVGYRTPAFEQYLRDVAEKWICSERKQTLYAMATSRPNNWGSMGFGGLCAIYAYLGDEATLTTLRTKWVTLIAGPVADKGFKFGKDWWQADPARPLVINPKGTMNGDFVLDGLQPEEMRRGNSDNGIFQAPPATTLYPFEALQGMVTAARILDRRGMSIWGEGDNALYRAAYALQVYLAGRFGTEAFTWTFRGDDIWTLGFIDDAYGTSLCSMSAVDTRGFGKIAGFVYVTRATK